MRSPKLSPLRELSTSGIVVPANYFSDALYSFGSGESLSISEEPRVKKVRTRGGLSSKSKRTRKAKASTSFTPSLSIIPEGHETQDEHVEEEVHQELTPEEIESIKRALALAAAEEERKKALQEEADSRLAAQLQEQDDKEAENLEKISSSSKRKSQGQGRGRGSRGKGRGRGRDRKESQVEEPSSGNLLLQEIASKYGLKHAQ